MAGAFHAAAFDEYAFDVDYTSSSALFLSIAGIERAAHRVDETAKVLYGSLSVVDVLNATPNTCTFTAKGFVPEVGQRVLVSLGGASNPSRLFAGTVLTCRQSYVGTPANAVYEVSCADDTWKLGQVKVTKRYTAQSATDIAEDLIDTYAPDFDTTDIEAALDDIDEITFTNETLSACLTRLAARIGGYWYVDEFESIHFFVTDTATDPDDLTDVNPPLSVSTVFSVDRDISQMITRVLGEGGGSTVLSDVAVGDTILPVDSVDYFNVLGGSFVCGPQRGTYTGLAAGGTGGLVGTGAAPTTPLAGALSAGTGVESGPHDYAYTFVTGAGETVPSPLASVTVGTVAAPSAAPSAALAVGAGMTNGDHYFAVTFETATGETTSSPVSLTVSCGPVTSGVIAAPITAPTKTVSTTTGNLSAGDRTHRVTFTNAAGETTVGPSVSSTVVALTANIAGISTQSGASSLDLGDHRYSITLVSATGETTEVGAVADATVSSPDNTVVRLLLPAITDARATHFRIYRSKAADPTGDRFLLATVAVSGSTQAYLDTTADASLSATEPPVSDTASTASITLTNIPIGPAGTTGRKIYRTAAGSGVLGLVTTLANNTATSYVDNTADGGLGAAPPGSNTTGTTVNYNQVALTNLPIGPPATTARKIYGTAAGGAQLKLIATIADNSTLTYTVTTADGSLGANIPVSNTATANQVALTAIVAGPSGTTSRKVYRTVASGSQLKLLATIADNTTLVYTDSTADASLGANAPSSDTSGLTQPTGQVLAGATSIPVSSPALMPSAGWAKIGNGEQVIRYTGKTASTLTGIPASGPGAITATVAYNSSITATPQLTGIPASSDGSILYAITKSDPVNLFIVEDDLVAQATLSNAIGSGDGIVEEFIQDRRLTETEIRARARAVLAQRAQVDASITYAIGGKPDPACRDHRSGRTIVVDLPDMDVDESFKIQTVRITNFEPGLEPVFNVEASTNRFSFEDLLRMARGSNGASL